MRVHNITRSLDLLSSWCMHISYLCAVISACKAEACNKAKDCFDLFHVDVFLPQNCTVEMNVGCMGIRAPEWDGITLPVKAKRFEKEKKILRLLFGYSSFPINLQKLLSLPAEAVFLGGRCSLSHTEVRNCPWKVRQVLLGSIFSQQEISSSFCYAKTLVPKPMFYLICAALWCTAEFLIKCLADSWSARCSERLVTGLK